MATKNSSLNPDQRISFLSPAKHVKTYRIIRTYYLIHQIRQLQVRIDVMKVIPREVRDKHYKNNISRRTLYNEWGEIDSLSLCFGLLGGGPIIG